MSITPEERIGQLQDMCNTYGDFKVAIAERGSDGEIRWTKHKSIMECWHSDSGLWFLSKANNRTILQCELILDIDKEPSIEKVNTICDILDTLNAKYQAYFTGSKGYHIHIIDTEFLQLENTLAEKIKKVWIKTFDCDILKSSTKVMIALENVPHWKTGQPKTLIRCSK